MMNFPGAISTNIGIWKSRKVASVFGYLSILIGAIAQLLLIPFMKKILGTDGLGVHILLQQVFNLCLLAELGAFDGALTYLSKNSAADKQRHAKDVVGSLFNMMGIVVALVVLFTMSCIAIFSSIGDKYRQDIVYAIPFVAIWGYVRIQYGRPRIRLISAGMVARASMAEVVTQIAKPLGVIVGAMIFRSPLGAFLAMLSFEAIGLVITLNRFFWDKNLQKRIEWRETYELWLSGVGTSLNAASTVAIPYLATTYLGFTSGATDVALFQIAMIPWQMVYRLMLTPLSAGINMPILIAWRKNGLSKSVYPPKYWKTMVVVVIGGCVAVASSYIWQPIFSARWVGKDCLVPVSIGFVIGASIVGWIVSYSAINIHMAYCSKRLHIAYFQMSAVLIGVFTVFLQEEFSVSALLRVAVSMLISSCVSALLALPSIIGYFCSKENGAFSNA